MIVSGNDDQGWSPGTGRKATAVTWNKDRIPLTYQGALENCRDGVDGDPNSGRAVWVFFQGNIQTSWALQSVLCWHSLKWISYYRVWILFTMGLFRKLFD
jgi:hypothetical protein